MHLSNNIVVILRRSSSKKKSARGGTNSKELALKALYIDFLSSDDSDITVELVDL